MGGEPTAVDTQRTGREIAKRRNETRWWESESRLRVIFRVGSPSCAAPPRNSTVIGAHLGRAGQERTIDPHDMTRLVKLTAVGEGK